MSSDPNNQRRPEMPKFMDVETDNAELEAELLKGIQGGFTEYSSEEMRDIGERIIKLGTNIKF